MKVFGVFVIIAMLFGAEALRAMSQLSSATSTVYSRPLFQYPVRFCPSFSLNKAKISLRAHETDGLVEKWKDELKSLHGTPELVDRLENLVANHPGIENNIKLYRTLYPFPLDDFQEEGLQCLQGGNNVLVTTPTGSG